MLTSSVLLAATMLTSSVLLAATVLTSSRNYGQVGNGQAIDICSNTTCTSDIAGAGTDSCYCGPLQTLRPKPLDNYCDKKKGYSKHGGLCLQKYNGYWCDNLDFFKKNHPLSSCKVEHEINEQYNVTVDGDTSYQYSGAFKVKRSGRYSFQMLCSDGCAMMLGGKTIVQSPKIKNQPNAIGVPCDNHVYLKKGVYKINILYGIASADLLTNKEKQISFKWKGDRADSSFTTKLSENYFPASHCSKHDSKQYRYGGRVGSKQNSYSSNSNYHSKKSYSQKPKTKRPYGPPPSPPPTPPPTPSNAITNLPAGPIRTKCVDPRCISGGCPRNAVYMLRVEPLMGTYMKNEAWAGAHITMSSQDSYDTDADKALALYKWEILKEKFDSFGKFNPTTKNWKEWQQSRSCICGMLLRSIRDREEFVILNEIGEAIKAAGFLNPRLDDYHITIANHKPDDCDGTNANIPKMATEFFNAGYTLVLAHFDKSDPTRLYRVRQHRIS